MSQHATKPNTDEYPAELTALSHQELVALVLQLQQQVREIQAENERFRDGAYTRYDKPVPGETSDEHHRRITGDPRIHVHRRRAGPVPPFEPRIRVDGNADVLDLLGKRDEENHRSDERAVRD